MADPTPLPYPSPYRRNEPAAILPEKPRLWGRIPASVRQAILALIVSIVAAVLGRYGIPVQPEVREKIVEVAPIVDTKPIDYEGCAFHGSEPEPEHLLEAQAARWPVDRITYGIDYASARGMSPPLSDDAIRSALRTAAGWWAEHLDLEFVEVPHGSAMIPIRFEFLDGPAGTLAQAYLADGTTRPKPMTFDSRERWTPGLPAANLVSLPTVACHELGHSLGLGHDAQNAPAVMRPTYTSAIPREQERDIARMIGLGYRRRPAVPPAAADVLNVPVQIRTTDVIEALQKAGYKVGK